jgi:FkbM family methyltransferase
MRSLKAILKAPFEWRHYRAAANMLRTYDRPYLAFQRYLFGGGSYPTAVTLATPSGPMRATVYSHHDILTINEIFCRRDYEATADAAVIVDFGSNIGISALYFLSRNPRAHAYLFEPLPMNIERLQANLAGLAGRFTLFPFAVGIEDGDVRFGCEPTGRYGGIGLPYQEQITVRCRPANAVIDQIIDRHGQIDVLKVDIESFEREIVLHLGERAKSIRTILVECRFGENPLAATHHLEQYGNVARFRRKG